MPREHADGECLGSMPTANASGACRRQMPREHADGLPRSMSTANASGACRRRMPRTRVDLTVPTDASHPRPFPCYPPNRSSPSAFAVGMPPKFVKKNVFALRPHASGFDMVDLCTDYLYLHEPTQGRRGRGQGKWCCRPNVIFVVGLTLISYSYGIYTDGQYGDGLYSHGTWGWR